MSPFNKMDSVREEAKRKQKERADEANKAMGLTSHGQYRTATPISSNPSSDSEKPGPSKAKKWATVKTGHGRKLRKTKKTRRHRKTGRK